MSAVSEVHARTFPFTNRQGIYSMAGYPGSLLDQRTSYCVLARCSNETFNKGTMSLFDWKMPSLQTAVRDMLMKAFWKCQ